MASPQPTGRIQTRRVVALGEGENPEAGSEALRGMWPGGHDGLAKGDDRWTQLGGLRQHPGPSQIGGPFGVPSV